MRFRPFSAASETWDPARSFDRVRLLLALTPFFLLPLWIDPLFVDPTRDGRFIRFEFLVALLLILEVFPSRYRGGRGWGLLRLSLAGLGLLFLVHVAVDPYLPGAFGRKLEAGQFVHHRYAFRYAVRYGAFLLWALLVLGGGFGPDFPRKALDLVMVVSISVALYAVLQFFGLEFLSWETAEDRMRVMGTMGNPLFLADYMAICIILFLGNFVRKRSRGCRVFSAVSVVILLFALLASESRGALISLVVGLAALVGIRLAVAGHRIHWKRTARMSGMIVLVALVIIVLLSQTAAFHPFVERFQDAVSLSDFSILARLVLWQVAFREWTVSPWIGVGMEQYRLRHLATLNSVIDEFPEAAPILGTSKVVAANEAHGDYLQILAEWGVIGLALVTLILTASLVRSAGIARDRAGIWPFEDRRVSEVIFACIITICVEMIYAFPLRLPSHSLLIFTFIGISGYLWDRAGGTAEEASAGRFRRPGVALRRFGAAALGVLIGAYSLMVFRGETAGAVARQLLVLGGGVQRAEKAAELAYHLLPENGNFAFLYGLTLWEQNKDPETVLELFNRAELTSTNTRVPIAKGTLLLRMGRHEQAYQSLQKVARYEASLEGLHYSRGLIFFLRGQYRQAAKELEAEVRLYPESYRAYIYLGLAYQQIGKTQLAVKALKGALRVKPRGLEALIQLGEVYAAAGEYPEAESRLKAALTLAEEIGDRQTATEVETRLRQIRLERGRE